MDENMVKVFDSKKSILESPHIKTDRINMTINPTKRLNKLTAHAQNVLQRADFADWAPKERISSAFDKLNEKMLSAYNRCGGGPNGTDDDEDELSKGKICVLFFQTSVRPTRSTMCSEPLFSQDFKHGKFR